MIVISLHHFSTFIFSVPLYTNPPSLLGPCDAPIPFVPHPPLASTTDALCLLLDFASYLPIFHFNVMILVSPAEGEEGVRGGEGARGSRVGDGKRGCEEGTRGNRGEEGARGSRAGEGKGGSEEGARGRRE